MNLPAFLRERLNAKIVCFALLISAPFAAMTYWYVSEFVSGGVHDRGSYLEVDLKAMSNFELDPVCATIADIPLRWRELDGKRVELFGEMYHPTSSEMSLSDFCLVYSLANCCGYGGAPKVQHLVESRLPPGKRTNYYRKLVRVIGTLHVDLKRDAEKVLSVYQLDVESVDPV